MEILSIAPPAGFPAQQKASPALPQRFETPVSEALNAPSEQALSKVRDLLVQATAKGGGEAHLIDAIDQAFDEVLRELTGNIDRLTDKQEVRQAEISDLRQVQAYLASHSDETHPFNLSDQITLSPHSPLSMATATVEQVMAYYRRTYPELSLPHPPKTIAELVSYNKALGDGIQLTLAPGSRLSMVALQDYVSRLHAMRDFQGSVYRTIYDVRKQYVRGM